MLFRNPFHSHPWMHTRQIRFTNLPLCVPFPRTATVLSGLFIYFINPFASYFPHLLFQTRYGTNCFAKQATEGEREARSVSPHVYRDSVGEPCGPSHSCPRAAMLRANCPQCSWTSQTGRSETPRSLGLAQRYHRGFWREDWVARPEPGRPAFKFVMSAYQRFPRSPRSPPRPPPPPRPPRSPPRPPPPPPPP